MLNIESSTKGLIGRRRLLQRQPLSIQINSEEIRSLDTKLPLSKSISSPVSQLTERSKNRKPVLQLAHQISDVFSSKQVTEALNSVRSVPDRLKMLDYILDQRKHKKDQEEQERLERAAPIIKNFRKNIQNKVKNELQGGGINRFRASCQDLQIEGAMPALPKLEIFQSGEGTCVTINLPTGGMETQESEMLRRNVSIEIKNSASYPFAETRNASLPLLAIPENTYPQAEQTPTLAFLELPAVNMNPSLCLSPTEESACNLPITPRRGSLTSMYSRSQIIEKFASFMGKKKRTLDSSNDSKTKKWSKPMTAHYVQKNVQDVAKRTLEEDLYRYLLNNKSEERGIKQSFGMGKQPKMNQIEKKALNRFETFQIRKRSKDVGPLKVLPMTPRTELHISPKTAQCTSRVYKGNLTTR